MAAATDRCAVVTGANRGIGYGICRQLALKGIVVVLTARDEKKGVEAVEKLKESGVSDRVVFHQLDVVDLVIIAALADFIKNKCGKLDILIKNERVPGAKIDVDALAAASGDGKEGAEVDWSKILTQNCELAEECLKINYYGPKGVTEVLIPLRQLSNSPRIVNVSASMGKLESGQEECWVILKALQKKDNEILSEFLKDFKEGSCKAKGWPDYASAYIVSKASLNAYTRIVAKKYPYFLVNCVCPGYVKTDMNHHHGVLTSDEGTESASRLALLSNGGSSGLFFVRNEVSTFD